MPFKIFNNKDVSCWDVVTIILLLAIAGTGMGCIFLPALIVVVVPLMFIAGIITTIRRRTRLRKERVEASAVIENLF